MAEGTEHSATAGSEEQASRAADSEEQVIRVPRWLVVTAALALAGAAGVIVYGYLARPNPDWIGVAGKNVWDWLDLLVVPAALAIGVYWLNTRQAARQQQAEDQRQAREEKAQEAQVQHALDVEDQRAQDAALQAYLDQMSHLLTDAARPLRRAQPSDDLSIVARARTLTVLPRLDGHRKARVVQFLYESGLIRRDRAVLDLSGADLREADASRAYLLEADLSGASLSDANLSEVNLSRAYLGGAKLSDAYLIRCNLSDANLSHAYLLKPAFRMENVNLSRAYLFRAYLFRCNLREANLSDANLSDAKRVTNEQLSAAESLKGTTMPDGQTLRGPETPNGPTFEDWLKDKKAREENA